MSGLSMKPIAGSALPVVVSSYIRHSLREKLETHGIGYLDRRGNVHLSWPDGLIHIEASASRSNAFTGDSPGTNAGLGVHGVRAVQALLSEPEGTQLSHLAGIVELSKSRTHAILQLLEAEGLVGVTGKGPATRRRVIDRSQLLDWLVSQPAAHRREPEASVAVYARTPHETWRLVRDRLDRARIPHGLTGSAAAAFLNVGPTSVPISSVRVSPRFSFEDAIAALGAERTQRGANIRLIRDTGMVGSTLTVDRDGVRIAPLVRVYLDALGERRGEDIAQRFREVILGY